MWSGLCTSGPLKSKLLEFHFGSMFLWPLRRRGLRNNRRERPTPLAPTPVYTCNRAANGVVAHASSLVIVLVLCP